MEKIQGLSVQTPHLPADAVRSVLASLDGTAQNRLSALGVRTLRIAAEPYTDAEIRLHSDLSFCPLGGGEAFLSETQTGLYHELSALGWRLTQTPPPRSPYPGDVGLNFLVGKDFALGNLNAAAPGLTEALRQRGIRLLHAKQGYAKCAVCPLNADAYITDDPGIARILKENGKDVLQIRKGDVRLSEAHYGFFGGAAGLLAPDVLAVNGSLRYHSDADAIRAFLKKHRITAVELFDGPIRDIGGIIPLTEESFG